MDGNLTLPTPDPRGHVVVVGGGIAGLAAVHRLVREAPDVHVTLIEAEDRLGGKIATERDDDFVIESGPESFLAGKPRGVGLAAELGLADRLQGVVPQPKRAFILHRNRLHDLPEGLTGLVPTRLAPLARSSLLSPWGKARVALDYVLPARRDVADEPLGAFIRRRLGHEAWERLVEPLMAGIYAADGDELSLAATFPQLREAERQYGGVIRGVLAARGSTPASDRPRSPFLAPAGGLGELVSALDGQLREGGASVRTGAGAASVSIVDGGYEIQLGNRDSLRAGALILATPAFATADLLAGIAPSLANDLAGITHSSTAIVTLAYRRDDIPHPLNGHGYVVPRAEGLPILACTWSSRKWAARAPNGWELLRVFIGRSGDRQVDVSTADDASLIGMARQEVTARLGVSAAPGLTRVHRWPQGMPQYTMGHPERVARIEAATQALPGLLLAGAAYRGVGLPDCIASGERAAESAMAHLRTQATDARQASTSPAPTTPSGSRIS